MRKKTNIKKCLEDHVAERHKSYTSKMLSAMTVKHLLDLAHPDVRKEFVRQFANLQKT